MIKKMLLLALPLFGCTLFLHAAEPVRQVYPLAPEAVAANDAQVKADMQKVSADWQKSPVFYYAVEPMSDIRRLPDLYPVDGRGAGTLDVMAAKGEFEPASFLVYPHQNVDKFELKVSDLKGKKGGVIPASALDLKLVKIWYQCGSAWFGYMADPLGRALTPELLVNDENMIIADATTQDNYARYSNADGSTHYEWISADYMVTDYKNSNLVRIALIKDADTLQPVVLNKNEFKQFMVTIHVPANAEAGIYTGTIDMFADGKKAGTIPVQLGVLPFTLPQARTNYDLNKPFFLSPYETLEPSYPDEGILRNLVNHNVTNPFGFPNIDPDNEAAFVRDIKLAKKVGASLRPIFSGPAVDLTVSDPATPEELVKLEALKKKLKAAAEMCKKHLGHTDFYSYAFDEGGYATIKKERHAWHAAHNVGAKVRVSTLPHEKMLYASIQNLLNVTGSTILNNFTAVYGASAVAAMGVSHKINMLPIQVCMGFSQGIMPLVSYNYASGNRKRMKDAVLFSSSIILPIMLAVTVGYWFGAPSLIRLFMDNPEIVAYGSAFLRGMCLGMVFLCVDFMAVGVFASLGKGKYSLTFAILRKVVLEIPLLFVLNALWPLYGLAYAQFLTEVILAIAAIIMLVRIFNDKA